jgi:hypothetical protein
MPKLINHVLSVVMPPDHARKLTQIAEHKGVSVGELVHQVLAPLLGEDDDEDDGRWVLLRISEDAYRTYLKFFEGDMRFVLQSMTAHVEAGGDDFSRALKVAGEM